MPDRPLQIALAQSASRRGDVAANIEAAARTVRAAPDAALVAFPELFVTGYELDLVRSTPSAWLEPDDARLDPVRRACADTGAVAVLGAALRSPRGPRLAAAIIYPAGR